MGKLSSDHSPSEIPPSSTILHHFSHPHPLQLLKFQPQQINTLPLPLPSCCKSKHSEWMYACHTCNYFLHAKCSQMSQEITHQSHHHNLKLILSPPYQNKSFSCDICKNVGSNHWLYRCDSCEFDAHLNCANAAVQQTHRAENGVDFGSHDFMRNYHDNVSANVLAAFANARTRQENMLASLFQQVGNNVNADHLLLQQIIAGGAGGVGGGSQPQAQMGGGNQLQALMGGGAGNPLQGLMGGGGGGNPLQGLLGGGGGGNPLQALMGGGNPLQMGGGGVADIVQTLIGGGGGGGGLLQGFLGGLGGF